MENDTKYTILGVAFWLGLIAVGFLFGVLWCHHTGLTP
jgi:hypothetical protein